MINQDKRDAIAELNAGAVVFDNPSFDDSIVGVTEDGCVVYNYQKMVEELCKDESWDETDAIEWIDFNTIRSIPYAGEYKPVIIYDLSY